MKKVLLLFTLSISIFMVRGLELPPEPDMTPLVEKILSRSGISPPYTNLTSDVQSLALAYKISSEQMTKVLEDIVREGVTELMKRECDVPWVERRVNIYKPIEMLQVFHGANTLGLLTECILSKDVAIFYPAAKTYISITGADSIPFFREAFERGELDRRQGGRLYDLIGGKAIIITDIGYVPFIERLKERNQIADLKKFCDFLKDMALIEQDLNRIQQLDRILCAYVDDYEASHHRTSVLLRIKFFEQGGEERDDTSIMEIGENEGVTPLTQSRKTVSPGKNETETPEQKSTPLWLWGIGIVIIVFGGVMTWRKIHGKKSV